MRIGDFVVSDGKCGFNPHRIVGFLWEFLSGPYCSVKTAAGMAYIKSAELTVLPGYKVSTDAGKTIALDMAEGVSHG